jgi:sorbitol/mannitol transport system substrate-binding protein
MKRLILVALVAALFSIPVFASGSGEEGPVTLTIATVNNPQMKIMEQYAPQFTEETGIELNFVVLPENELRQKVTNDVALGAGKYDIVTIGTYDTPFWAQNQWIVSLEDHFQAMTSAERNAYDRDDILAPIRSALSNDGELYALPFYGESSMLYYRTDIFEEAGISVPENPTWQQVYEVASQLHDPDNGFYGISLRGLPGWGQNMAVFGTLINAFGARWFDPDWNAAFDEPEMRDAWEFYKMLLEDAGQPNPTTDGYTECLTLMMNGRAAMYYDATVSAGTLEGGDSQVAGNVGWTVAPSAAKDNTGWLWAWSLAIESASKNKEAAFDFITWATSKEYIQLVGDNVGWQQAPPGTRTSTYENPAYRQAAPFADIVLNSIQTADYDSPTVKPVPYVGVQYVSIPEFQSLGEFVGQQLAAYISGQTSLDQALSNCQQEANRVAVEGGYQQN